MSTLSLWCFLSFSAFPMGGDGEVTTPPQDELDVRDDEQDERLDEIEEMLFEIDDRLGSRPPWRTYSATEVNLGGHVTTGGTWARGEDADTFAWSYHFIELYIQAKLSEKYSIFATPGFAYFEDPDTSNPAEPTHDNDFAAGGEVAIYTTLERAYGMYKSGDELEVKFGRIGTGHGVVTREYFVPSRLITTAPMLSRNFGGMQLYPQRVEGLSFAGARTVGETDRFEYEAYGGSPQHNVKDIAAGARFAYVFGELGLSVAANYGHAKRIDTESLVGGVPGMPGLVNSLNTAGGFWNPFPITSNTRNSFDFYGLDVDYRSGPWVVKSEIYETDEGEDLESRSGMYLQSTYFWTPEWGFSARADHFNPGQELGNATEHVLGVTFNPNSNVRFRFDYHVQRLPESANADRLDFLLLTASFSF